MNPLDPDFMDISDEQLAAMDAACSDYERRRTRGEDISIESCLERWPLESRLVLQRELLQMEMEILDAWDQLKDPEGLVRRFPEQQQVIQEYWEALQCRTGSELMAERGYETLRAYESSGSTQEEAIHPSRSASESGASLSHANLPRFRILRNLAQGGIGTLYVAYDEDLQREVAVKELKRKFAKERAVVQRFEREASITGNLEHPNIVPIYATGRRHDGRPYYAMRLIQGQSLQAKIVELHGQFGPQIDFEKCLAARSLLLRLVTVCRAVGFAHSRGILHRDLKPSNVMVGDFGETLVVDWGLARVLDADEAPLRGGLGSQTKTESEAEGCGLFAGEFEELSSHLDRTAYGTIVGTPGYMSPEQRSGRTDQLTVASDIYALGATLFQLLTNSIPTFRPETSSLLGGEGVARSEHRASSGEDARGELGVNTAFQNPLEVSRLEHLPASLQAICRKAMQDAPSERYTSAECLAGDLEAWLMDQPISVVTETRFQKGRRWAKSHPAMVAGGLASLLVTLVAMTISLSILSEKNASLGRANRREQAATADALRNAKEAQRHAKESELSSQEATRQQQRVLGILNTFLVDVERGLADVPGGAAIQRNVLTTVLNQLADISGEYSDPEQVSFSHAMALMDVGDLFARVGTKGMKIRFPHWQEAPISPLEAADTLYAEAIQMALRSGQDERTRRRFVALTQQKRAAVLRQTSRTPEALALFEEALSTLRTLLASTPESREAVMDYVSLVDSIGQIHLQDGDVDLAKQSFEDVQKRLEALQVRFPDDRLVERQRGVVYSRMGDIAISRGDLDQAAKFYDQDLVIAMAGYELEPESATRKRDLCISLDRLGNMEAQRGRPEKAMEKYLESRRLREESHNAEPTDIRVCQELLVSYMKGGDTRMEMKELGRAKEDYAKAFALAEMLAERDPRNAVARRFQSISAEVLADVALAEEKWSEALVYANKSLEICLEMSRKDANDGQLQRDLQICYAKVAKVLEQMQDIDASLEHLDRAVAIAERHHAQNATSFQSIEDCCWLYLRRAKVYLESESASQASEECLRAIALYQTIPAENLQDAKARRRMVNALTMLGRALVAEGREAEGLEALVRARTLAMAMIDENVRAEQMQLDLEEIEGVMEEVRNKE